MSPGREQAAALPPERIALVTPVRDEKEYIGAMLESIVAQKTRPATWIIVDDGSGDGTPEIVAGYAREHSFIQLIRLPAQGGRKPGGESAISHGLNSLKLSDFDFIARFDADLLFEPDYLAGMLQEFRSDPGLGIAGGTLYIERNGGSIAERAPEYHVRGAVKMYRRECFEAIGGLHTRIGWDTIDEVSAWSKGWTTRSFAQRVIHRRPTGEGLEPSRVSRERGKAEYFTWSHPLFVVAKSCKLARDGRRCGPALSFLAGFFCAHFQSGGRLEDRTFVRTRRQQQLARMHSALRAKVAAWLPGGIRPRLDGKSSNPGRPWN